MYRHVISATEPVLWHLICTEYSLISYYERVWENMNWSTQAQCAIRLITFMTQGHWALVVPKNWGQKSLKMNLRVFEVI